MWTFRCYALGQDGGFRGWYDSQTPELQAEMDTTLEMLAASETWEKSAYEDLGGKCEGLGEIKVDLPDDGVHIRLLGFKSERREFTLLVGFIKSINSDYSVYCPRALKRKEGVLKDGRRATPCSFP